jgi:hypothetical protein
VKEILEYIAKFLVDDPNGVQVSTLEGQRAVILQLQVAPDDMGKIIGKSGRVARALRTIIHAAALRDGKSAIVEIIQ